MRRAPIWFLLAASLGGAAPAGAPHEETLLDLAERGRTIAVCLQAVERARARLREHPGEVAAPDRILALPGRDGWRVILLQEGAGPSPKGPRVLAEIGYSPDAAEAGALRVMAPPRPAAAATTAHLRALQTATAAAARLPGMTPPLDEAVVREKNGSFSVYLLSRPASPGEVRFGGDVLVRVAASGRQVAAVETLHPGEPLDSPAAGRGPGQPTLHEHATGDLPSPTDVARVVLRPDVAPHLVLTRRFMFRIDARGGVVYLGPNRAAEPPAVGRR
jgi:hypothetical protein